MKVKNKEFSDETVRLLKAIFTKNIRKTNNGLDFQIIADLILNNEDLILVIERYLEKIKEIYSEGE